VFTINEITGSHAHDGYLLLLLYWVIHRCTFCDNKPRNCF